MYSKIYYIWFLIQLFYIFYESRDLDIYFTLCYALELKELKCYDYFTRLIIYGILSTPTC